MRHVIFRVEEERFALPLATVREVVVPLGPVSRIPRATMSMWGIINLRGRVVTVVDLAALLELSQSSQLQAQPAQPTSQENRATRRVLVLERARRDLGLLVSAVDGIHRIEEIAPAPGAQFASVSGIASVRGNAITILDAEGLDRLIVDQLKRPA